MKTLVMALPGAAVLAGQLCTSLGAEAGTLDLHRFPDGETCPQLAPSPAGRGLVLLAPLARPDQRLLALYWRRLTCRTCGRTRCSRRGRA
jgi:ribose-phosphate pyrophosphokinase